MAKKLTVEETQKEYDRGYTDALKGKTDNPHDPGIIETFAEVGTGAFFFIDQDKRNAKSSAWKTGNSDGQKARRN